MGCCSDKTSSKSCCNKQNDNAKADGDHFQNLLAAAEELPFEVAEVEDLEALAVIPAADEESSSKKKKEPCAFRLDGKPCKLCGDNEEDEFKEEEEKKIAANISTTTSTETEGPLIAERVDPHPQVLLQAQAQVQAPRLESLVADVAERKQELLASISVSKSTSEQMQPEPQQPQDSGPPIVSAKDAYERKKQRAKQTRVQLNDALERLGKAMERATDDSQRRVVHLHQLLTPLPKSLPHLEQTQNHPKCHHKTIIDRPTFVGAAVQILNGINQHCEALAQEVLRLRAQLPPQQGTTTTTATGTKPSSSDASTPFCQSNKRKAPPCCGSETTQKQGKRCCR